MAASPLCWCFALFPARAAVLYVPARKESRRAPCSPRSAFCGICSFHIYHSSSCGSAPNRLLSPFGPAYAVPPALLAFDSTPRPVGVLLSIKPLLEPSPSSPLARPRSRQPRPPAAPAGFEAAFSLPPPAAAPARIASSSTERGAFKICAESAASVPAGPSCWPNGRRLGPASLAGAG